ncbi:PAS domain S-box protein [Actinoplanes sp. NPDC051513]|uniref:PAS domain S-box protein n=1 Tax=Actinoplanes sp. NPDC051513 TaxID=3363908 RepID=UPI0037BAC2DB
MSVGYLDRPAESDALFRSLFDTSPIGMAVFDPDGIVVRVNAAALMLLGYPAPELEGRSLASLVNPGDHGALAGAGQRELRLLRKDGLEVACLVGVTSLGDDHRLAQIVDRSGAVAVERALRRSEEQFRAAFDASPIASAIAGEDARLKRVNPAFEALMGRSADDLIGRHFAELTHPDDRSASEREGQVVAADPAAASGFDKRYVRPDGTVVRARVGLTTIPGPDGTRDRFVQCEDITARELAEEQAAREAQRLRVTIAVQREVIAAARDQDVVLRLMADRALQVLPAGDAANVQLLDSGGGMLRTVAGTGALADRSIPPKPFEGSLAGLAMTTGAAVRCDDTWHDPRANHDFSKAIGVRSLVMAPLRTPDGPAGVIVVASRCPGAFGDADEQQLTLLADALAGALRHAADAAHKQDLLRQATDAVHALEQERAAERSARADLARSEEQFRTAFDGCPIGLLIADEHGRFQRANPAAATLTGRTRQELAGLTHRDITDPADIEATARARLALLRGAGEVTYDNRLVRPDGFIAWTRVTLSLIPGPAGRRWRLVQLQDITAERAAAAARDRELSRLRATLAVQREVTAAAGVRDDALRVVADRAVDLFDAADGSALELVDGDVLYYQATAGTLAPAAGTRIKIAGSLSGRVLVTDAPAHCADTADDPRVNREACERLGIGSMLIAPLHAENRVIGCLKISASRSHVFDDTDEQQLALLADSLSSALRHADDAERNAELLAERTRALAALEASETRFRLTFENSPLGLTLISMSSTDRGRYLQVNPAMTAITGYDAGELTRMTYKDLIVAEDVPSDETVRAAVATGLGSYRTELRYRHKDGHAVWVSLCGAPVRDGHGNPLYLVSQVEDITEKRAADAELRRHARLLALIPAAVIVRDPDGTIRWWNAGAEALYGWSQRAVAGKNVHRLLTTSFPAGGREADVRHSLEHDGHWAGQIEHRTADGRTVTVLSRQVLHRPGAGADPQVLEINTDVTAARAAEKALAESEQRFRAQFANSAAGQIIRSLDGSHVQVNPAYARMLGYTPEELAAIPDEVLVHPEDLVAARRQIAGLYAGDEGACTHEGRLRHRDGHWVDVAATISLVRDEAGSPKNLIGVVTDISGRRAAENARDQAAAALAERNKELEAANRLKLDLIGMLGHEIGNPLSSIRGYAEILAEGLEGPQRDRAVGTIGRQAARLDEIVREVLSMVSLDAGTITASRQELWLRTEVTRALAAMDLDHLPVAGPDVRVLFNAGHLQQIMVNLLSNAAKYGCGATAIKITGTRTGAAHVTVEDNGPGVPGEFQPRLFERMARADRDAAGVRGTGLGLYIVRGLAQANHGDIHHEPNPAGGSRFVLTLEACGLTHLPR